MATRQTKTPETGVVGRLAGRGEEAMSRLMDELGRNSKLTEALTRALAAKGMLDSASRTALTQVGLAPADEVRELRRRVIDLEKRLGKLEGASTPKRKPTTKTTSSRAKAASAKATSTAKTSRAGAARRRSTPKT